MERKKVTFYIDGFNFYYGLDYNGKNGGGESWKKYYWINIVKLCKSFLRPNEKLHCVKYFTARPMNNGKRERQMLLMKVNEIINKDKFQVYYGKYTKQLIKCEASCGQEFYRPEEKQTDVNIAVSIVSDYSLNNCHKIVLVSADSDLISPLLAVGTMEKKFKKGTSVNVIFPPGNFSADIKGSGYYIKIHEI